MKTNAQMDELLINAKKNPELLADIIPLYQSFAGYGNIKPFQHYQVQIDEICEKWQETNNLALIVRGLTDAWIQFCQGKLDSALKIVSELKLNHDLKIDSEHYGFAEVLMGTCMRNRGDIDVALVHLLNASKHINEYGPLATYSCFAYYHLGELHMQIKDITDAGKYFEKALSIAKRVNHKVSMFRSLIGLGSWYHAKNDHEKCIKYFNLALEVEPISEALKSRALRDLGFHYISQKNFKKAVTILEESYQLAIKNGYSNPASTSLIHLGEAYLNLKKPDLALSKLNEALKISLDLKTKAKQMDIESLLATTHETLQNYE